MTLTGRLLAFYLAAIAIVLAGSSVTLYWLAYTHLHRGLVQQLSAATEALVAAMETGPEGFEWEPAERILPSNSSFGGRVIWVVATDSGEIIGRSDSSVDGSFLKTFLHADVQSESVDSETWNGEHWASYVRQLNAPKEGTESAAAARAKRDPAEVWHPSLRIATATSRTPVDATMKELAIALVGVSSLVWVASLFVGRWFCRRALAPITEMAAAARGMNADGIADRFAERSSKDELSELSEAFNGLLIRLQDSLGRQQRFSSEASHQLRTPLTVILGQIDVAERRDRTVEEYRSVLESIRPQAESLHRMTESLLFLARSDSTASLPHLQSLDLADWLKHHFDLSRFGPRSNEVQLAFDGVGPFLIEAQSPLLAVLVGNLVENALKYSREGSGVSVRLLRDAASVVLVVEDYGFGISAQDLPHVFDPYFRSSKVREHGLAGFGLGLSIAKRIAEAFSATLRIESRLGEGTHVDVRFPSSGMNRHGGGQ